MARSSSLALATYIGLLAAVVLVSSPAVAQKKNKAAVKAQLEFGVDMARRGLWSEALFRFKQAKSVDPENPLVYNNLAVAHEALGLFEDALDLYRKGLELSPNDKGLRNNYARFLDFYRRFKPEEEGEPDDAVSPDSAAKDSAAKEGAELPPETSPEPSLGADGREGGVSLRNFSATERVASSTSVR